MSDAKLNVGFDTQVGAKVLSKGIKVSLTAPKSGELIEKEIARILTKVGESVNYKGKIIGHLKAIAVSGESYIQMSMTSYPHITVKADPKWHEQEYQDLDLTVNIIVFGYNKDQLKSFLEESVAGTLFSSFN